MKQLTLIFMISVLFFPSMLWAQQTHINTSRLENTLTAQTHPNMDNYLSASDEYGTPLALKLARQGDVQTLLELAAHASGGKFLTVRDKYNNNLFHVAKNADTVQAVAALIRRFYGADTAKQISRMVDARNALNETPLHAQINAAHTDTFRPIYRYTTLKKKNDAAKSHLARLYGSDARIFESHRDIYCADVLGAATANHLTLLQAAQMQTPYHPQMASVAQQIERVIPCLAQ